MEAEADEGLKEENMEEEKEERQQGGRIGR